jgi:hypothetical protein
MSLDGPDLVLQTRLTVSLVPEPSSLLLIAFGLLVIGVGRAAPVTRQWTNVPSIPPSA